MINLSVCFGMTKEYDKAIQMLERVLKRNPNHIAALTNIAILYRHIGNNAKAEEYNKRLQSLNGN